MNDILHGDCLDHMRDMPADSIDLIMTSPPYADARKHDYGGLPPGEYIPWFLERAAEMHRVLKPTGSLIINIKEKAVDGERHPYVMHLILEMRKTWRHPDEFIWVKPNGIPGKWPGRLKDGWERLLHFTREKHYKFHHDAVRVPYAKSSLRRKARLTGNDYIDLVSASGSGVRRKTSRLYAHDDALPNNVIESSVISNNKNHSAVFPAAIPEFFVKLMTDTGDTVYDPFAGSGTTCYVAAKLGRNWIGSELTPKYVELALKNLDKWKYQEKIA